MDGDTGGLHKRRASNAGVCNVRYVYCYYYYFIIFLFQVKKVRGEHRFLTTIAQQKVHC